MLLYSRKKVRYRRDGYCWKKRKDGKTTREDHMKLKVQGMEVNNIFEIYKTQCGKLQNFLSIRIYVKSKAVKLESQNVPTHQEALKFDFYDFWHFLKGDIYQINKMSLKNGKKGSSAASRFSQIDFTKKSE